MSALLDLRGTLVPAVGRLLGEARDAIGQPCQPGPASLLELGDPLVGQDAHHELPVFVDARRDGLEVNAPVSRPLD